QIDLLKRDRRRFGFRDVDPLTGAFMDSRVGGRPKKGVKRAPPNALDGGNYFRNLYSIMLERDVGLTGGEGTYRHDRTARHIHNISQYP
ncbi:unnamed protein product, partial [Ectocarpus sp. 4 AP-2014]